MDFSTEHPEDNEQMLHINLMGTVFLGGQELDQYFINLGIYIIK